MNLRVVSTQHIWSNIDSGIAGLLLELFPENLERVNPNAISPGQRDLPGAIPRRGDRPAPPKTTEYDVVTSLDGIGVNIRIKRPSGEIVLFGGDPTRAPAEVPAEVRAHYAQVYRPRARQ